MRISKRALVVREPWIGSILSGQKTWEMRSRAISVRGPIGLIRAGSGMVVGVAKLVDCLPPLNQADYFNHNHNHAIPETLRDSVFKNGWIYPWVLAHVRPLSSAVPYKHKSGAVTFVTLDDDVVDQIAMQLGAPKMTFDDAERIVPQRRGDHPTSVDRLGETELRKNEPTAERAPMSNTGTPTFVFRPQSAQAHGRPLPDGRFLVSAGSTAMRNGSPNVKRDLYDRDRLVREGILVQDTDRDRYRFAKDYVFGSSSKAAGVIKDGNASGPSLWKDVKTGQTLKDFLACGRC